MPAASEIDDIFASKGKAKAVEPVASTSTLPVKKSKKKKNANTSDDTHGIETFTNETDGGKSGKKRPAPETVIDPSTRILNTSVKRAKTAKATGADDSKGRATHSKKDEENEDRFKDSRGSGPRRKTDEGWAIYKEDELGIGNEGGDTPLCPFDCDCCF